MTSGLGSLRHVLAFALLTVAGSLVCRSRIHLPASLCSTRITVLLRSYEGSDSSAFTSARGRGIPDSPHLNFPVVLSPTTVFRSISAFFPLVCSRVLDSSLQRRFSSARIRSPGFAIHPQARHETGPNRVSCVRTDRIAFRCSPPRLATTQLRSAFNQSSVWLRGFSPPFQMCSRAHERGRPRPQSADLRSGDGKRPGRRPDRCGSETRSPTSNRAR